MVFRPLDSPLGAAKIARALRVGILCLAGSLSARAETMSGDEALKRLDACNVTWDTLGKSSLDSMPLGNGDLAANIWVEENGDVCLYLSKSDAWSESIQSSEGLVKLARVRISFSPNPFAGKSFKQSLVLREGAVELSGADAGGNVKVRVWVDANENTLRVLADGDGTRICSVTLDPVRTKASLQAKAAWLGSKLHEDVVVPEQKDCVTWYYRNSKAAAAELKLGPNYNEGALDGLTFGGQIEGPGFARQNDLQLRAGENRHHEIRIKVLTQKTETVERWLESVNALPSRPAEETWAGHEAWWRSFWTRSWIFVEGDADAQKVTVAYILQRFMNACSCRGPYPAKFNGSLFTTDMEVKQKEEGKDVFYRVDGDFRRWGGRYWFQNTRLIYWPMLASGDFDLMRPFFDMYKNILEVNEPMIKEFHGFEGAVFEETSFPHGGISKTLHETKGHLTRHYWLGSLEYICMAVEFYRYTLDEEFARKTLIPSARRVLGFYSAYWPDRDASGKLVLDPLNSGETWVKVKNPAPDVAALHVILRGLLELPESILTPEQKEAWQKLQSELPPIPLGEKDGDRVVLAAEDLKGQVKSNFENPELYAVFPFGVYGVGKAELEMARNTFKHRLHQSATGGGWNQDPPEAALLGLVPESRKYLISMSGAKDPTSRFPAFWMGHQDYVPNFCHGGILEITLQAMLLQIDGSKIILFPAWPREWNVDFKLEAPGKTTVQGSFQKDRGESFEVQPQNRKADVVLAKDLEPKK